MRKIVFVLHLTSLLLTLGIITHGQIQTKATVRKTRTSKIINPRLAPPAYRKFNHSFELTSEYDKFKNITEISLRIPINEIETLYFHLWFYGEKIKGPPNEILFNYFGDSRKFPSLVTGIITVTDKDLLHFKLLDFQPNVNGKTVLVAKLTYPTLLRLANALSIDMKIGSTILRFDDASLEALKDFASRTNPNINRDAEIAERRELEKTIDSEALKLKILNPSAKATIKQLLERASQMAVLAKKVLLSENPPTEDALTILELAPHYKANETVLPSGIFKNLLASSVEDITCSIIIFEVDNGVLSEDNPNIKGVAENAIKKYRLTAYREEERPMILLSKAEESLYYLYTLASAAGIVHFEE